MAAFRGLEVIRTGDYVHVSNHAVDGQDMFRSQEDREKLLELLEQYRRDDVVIVAWCIVGNHFHILFKLLGEPEALSIYLRNVQSAYADWFNRRYARRGALHWRRYDRRPTITTFGACVVTAYIHANRVKDGFCTDPATDRWSSHPDYLGLCAPRLVDLTHRDLLFGDIGGYVAAFRELLPHWSERELGSAYEQLLVEQAEAVALRSGRVGPRYLDAVRTAALVRFAGLTPAQAAARVGLNPKNGARSLRRAVEHAAPLLEALEQHLAAAMPLGR